MARRPRVEMVGFHHVLNRGVERRDVFLEREDYDTFVEIFCDTCTLNDATVHSYCLMTNHYHLLLETTRENLSKVMRSINANYAAWFNRKYKRTGHLWQGRYKSWYVMNEAYLYTLIKYIEFNPLKAKMVENLNAYPYSSYHLFCNAQETIPECLRDSLMYRDFKSVEDRRSFFESWYDETVVGEMTRTSRLVVTAVPETNLSNEALSELFSRCVTREDRNRKVLEAIKAGYSQRAIADVLQISQPAVSQIVKKERKER